MTATDQDVDVPVRRPRSGVLAAHKWPTNGHLIADVAELYELDPRASAVDVTYGLGKWWTLWRPYNLVPHDLDPRKGDGVDYRHLPEEAETYDLAAFDPPYVAPGGRKTSTLGNDAARVGTMLDRYGMHTTPATPAENQASIEAGLAELYRVLRPSRRVDGRPVTGIALVKVMDYVNSGRLFPGTHYTAQAALEMGFRLEDRIEHIGKPGPQPTENRDGSTRRQLHARRNYTTLLILTKGPK